MSQSIELESRLEQLGQELSGAPDFAQQILSEIASESTQKGIKVDHPARRTIRRFAAMATAAALILAVGWWMLQPQSLYAQAVAALQKVDVVHATGWTTKVVRKWPLENDVAVAEKAKHKIDAWYWIDETRNSRAYEALGPITITRNGDTLNEYQRDADLLYVFKGKPKDYISRFETLSDLLRILETEGIKTTDLGSREIDGNVLRGTRLKRNGGTEEFWFDSSSSLPVSFTRSHIVDDRAVTDFELKLSYDDPLPDTIASYSSPATENMRYGGQMDNVAAVWDQHVQNVGAAIAKQPDRPLPRIVERTGQKTFSYQYTKLTPDGRFWVIPLDSGRSYKLNVKDFIRHKISGETYRWRVAPELANITFERSDLVCKKDTSWQESTSFALASVGLEFTTVEEDREFWIAKYDGVTRKSYKDVHPPVPYIGEGGQVKRGVVSLGVGHVLRPVSLDRLFRDFHSLQNTNSVDGTHPIIVDQTGLPMAPKWDRSKYDSWADFEKAVNYEQYLVANDSPWFVGKGSLEMARQWYKKELGITFDSETRKLTTYIVRRKN